VSKIIDKSEETGAEIVKTYKYGKNESGQGHCSIEPSPQTFVYESYQIDGYENWATSEYYRYRERLISPVSKASSFYVLCLAKRLASLNYKQTSAQLYINYYDFIKNIWKEQKFYLSLLHLIIMFTHGRYL